MPHDPSRESFTRLPRLRISGCLPQHTGGTSPVLDAFDEAVFSYALREAFPEIRIIGEYDRRNPPPVLPEVETIADCEYHPRKILIPIVEQTAGGEVSRTWQHFNYWRSYWDYSDGPYGNRKWAFDPPTLTEASLTTSWDYGDNLVLSVIRKVWRVLRKVTTSQGRWELPHLPPMDIDSPREGRTRGWYGFHAMEWCAREPGRMLDGIIRPVRGFQPPQTPWYQNLRQKVIERYGDRLEDPGPPRM